MQPFQSEDWWLALRLASEARSRRARRPSWDLLTRFVEASQSSTQPACQRRLILDLVRDATAADVAFLYSNIGEVVDVSGSPSPLPEACRRIAQELLELSGSGFEAQIHWPTIVDGSPAHGFPGGVAMVRLGGPASSWLVALASDPDRPLNRDDLHLIQIAARLLSERLREARSVGRLRDAMLGLVRDLANAADAQAPGMLGHAERVGRIAMILGRRLGLDEAKVGDLYIAGLLHDIGNLHLSDDLLGKSGPWTAEERSRNAEHPILGERIVALLPPLAYLGPGIRHHHEHFDGLGYPDGLAGDAIPLMARLLSVADACDALLSPRCLRGPYDTRQTEKILTLGAGSQWDPRVIGAFLDAKDEIFRVAGAGFPGRPPTRGPKDRPPEDNGF